jgi:hypothetical protein
MTVVEVQRTLEITFLEPGAEAYVGHIRLDPGADQGLHGRD